MVAGKGEVMRSLDSRGSVLRRSAGPLGGLVLLAVTAAAQATAQEDPQEGRELSRAESEIEYLGRNGFEARYVEVMVKDQAWYRIYVGRFATREEAARMRLELLELRRISYARVSKITE